MSTFFKMKRNGSIKLIGTVVIALVLMLVIISTFPTIKDRAADILWFLEDKAPDARILYFNVEPEPFYDDTAIKYKLDKAAEIEIKIFDQQEKVIWRKEAEYKQGVDKVVWDGKNEDGELIPLNTDYFVVLSAGKANKTQSVSRILMSPGADN